MRTAAGLGGPGDDQAWEVIDGAWAIAGEGAIVGDAGEGTRLAVAPQLVNDGLAEVTLSLAAAGSGLSFRYEDPDNWWTVTVSDDRLSWVVTQVIDGEETIAGTFSAPVYDGLTISVTQAGPTVRFLVDGVEYFRLLAPAPAEVTRSGLAARGAQSGAGRWDRFLLMASEADVDANS